MRSLHWSRRNHCRWRQEKRTIFDQCFGRRAWTPLPGGMQKGRAGWKQEFGPFWFLDWWIFGLLWFQRQPLLYLESLSRYLEREVMKRRRVVVVVGFWCVRHYPGAYLRLLRASYESTYHTIWMVCIVRYAYLSYDRFAERKKGQKMFSSRSTIHTYYVATYISMYVSS